MNYFRNMRRLLMLDRAVYTEIYASALSYCVVNVALLGLIYGGTAVRYSEMLLEQMGKSTNGNFNPLLVIMAGVSVAFLMHGGAALFIWVFCRGIGGRPAFLPLYLNMGIAAIAFWPLAPSAVVLQAGAASPAAYFYTLLAAAYALAVAFIAIKQSSGLSTIKALAAVAASIIYAGCFLYLWV
jgi:hypothetical protein